MPLSCSRFSPAFSTLQDRASYGRVWICSGCRHLREIHSIPAAAGRTCCIAGAGVGQATAPTTARCRAAAGQGSEPRAAHSTGNQGQGARQSSLGRASEARSSPLPQVCCDRCVLETLPAQPTAHRRWLWPKLCGAKQQQRIAPERYDELVATLDSIDPAVVRGVDVDLPRTFGGHSTLHTPEMSAKLRRVLLVYAQHDPAVGYCQVRAARWVFYWL